MGQRSAMPVPPLRHSPTRFGREIFFENRGGKSRLLRRAYEKIREDCAEAVGQEGIKSLIKRAPWVDDMDYHPTRYGARFNLRRAVQAPAEGVLVGARIERNQSKGARYPGLVLATRPGRLSLTRKVRHLPLCFSFVG